MTRLAQTTVIPAVTIALSGPGWIERLRRHVVRVNASMACQSRLSSLQAETLRDTGLSPEDLTGAPSYDPALPFFMQSRFGRSDK